MSVPFWVVVAVLVVAVLGTLASLFVALVFARRAHNAEERLARLKALEERAVKAAYANSPGQLFDFAAGLRRQIAVRILTGEDPVE